MPQAQSTAALPLWIVASITAAFFLREARDVFRPIAVAILLSFALMPLVDLLRRARLAQWATVMLVLGALTMAAGWGTYALGESAVAALTQLPRGRTGAPRAAGGRWRLADSSHQ